MRTPSRVGRASAAVGGLRARLGERLGAAVPERVRRRGARGTAELSVVMVVGAMVAGVVFGQGITRTAVEIADGLTWLSDSPSGRVIQVNPATGRPELALQVGEEGDDLELVQYDGRMYVLNRTTGALTAYDLTSILRSGQRRITEGGAVHTLRVPGPDGALLLVDDETSTISAIDPVSTASIGTTWVSATGLADAAVDDTGTVWALEDDGSLHELAWNAERLELRTTATQAVERSGPGSVLVAHPEGVTVFGPDQGIVAQVGTGEDTTAEAPKLVGELLAPEHAPAELVPVAAPESSTVALLSPGELREVSLAPVGCAEPGTPEVFHDVVYVPCGDGEKVVRLGSDGQRVGEDIATPGATPELVLDDDLLIINTPGTPEAVVVEGDGTTETIVRDDPDLVTTPGVPTGPRDLQETLDDLLQPILGDRDDQERPAGEDGGVLPELRPGQPTARPTDRPTDRPTGRPGTAPTGNPGTTPSGSPTGTPGTPCRGRSRCGESQNPQGTPSGTPSGSPSGGPSGSPTPPATGVPTTGQPGSPEPPAPTEPGGMVLAAPTAVTAQATAEGRVTVSWNHAGTAAESFVVAFDGGQDITRVDGQVRQVQLTVPPGQSVAFVVTAVAEGRRAASTPSNIVTTNGPPGEPAQVTGGAEYVPAGNLLRFVVTVRWGAAPANGSEVTRYDVSVATPDGTQAVSVGGGERTASVEWSCDLNADAACQVGGDATASVTAVNAVGAGRTVSTQITGPQQPAPPLPAKDAAIATAAAHRWTGDTREGFGETTLTLRPPADWAAFSGTCEWRHTGNRNGASSGPVACDATSLTVNINTGYIWEPADGRVSHSIVFTASNAGGQVQSRTFTWVTRQTPLCERCQIP